MSKGEQNKEECKNDGTVCLMCVGFFVSNNIASSSRNTNFFSTHFATQCFPWAAISHMAEGRNEFCFSR